MNTKKDRLEEAYEHLHKHYGIHTKKDLAIALRVKQAGLYSAMNGNDAYLTKSLFQKVCGAFPGVFNLDYLLTGEGDLLTVEEDAKSAELENPSTPDCNPDQTYIMSKMFESMLKPIEAAHAQTIASLNRQIADKQSIIDLQAEKIKSQADEIARLQKVISELRSIPSQDNIEDVLKKYPFTVGVADEGKNTSAHV